MAENLEVPFYEQGKKVEEGLTEYEFTLGGVTGTIGVTSYVFQQCEHWYKYVIRIPIEDTRIYVDPLPSGEIEFEREIVDTSGTPHLQTAIYNSVGTLCRLMYDRPAGSGCDERGIQVGLTSIWKGFDPANGTPLPAGKDMYQSIVEATGVDFQPFDYARFKLLARAVIAHPPAALPPDPEEE